MARADGYDRPSERRRWFKVMEDILHDERIVRVGNDGLAAYLRLLAMLNQSVSHDGKITLSDSALQVMTGKRRRDAAERLLQRLADVGLTFAERRANVWALWVPKWAEINGHTSTTKKKTKTKTKKESTPSFFPSGEEGKTHDPHALNYAWVKFEAWAERKKIPHADRESIFRKAMSEVSPWPLDGYEGQPPPGGRYRQTEGQRRDELDRQAEAARARAERQSASQTKSSEALRAALRTVVGGISE